MLVIVSLGGSDLKNGFTDPFFKSLPPKNPTVELARQNFLLDLLLFIKE